jgi:hypothetical protein
VVHKVGIVYSTNNGMVRRVLFPDQEEQDLGGHLQYGESLLVVPSSAIDPRQNIHGQAVRSVAYLLGTNPKHPRCAVVDASGTVVSIGYMDDEIDHVDGHTLINSKSLQVGDKAS